MQVFLMMILLLLSWLYGGIMRLRNWLFDHNIRPVYRSSIPTIGVGNLTVGGTGKTPMVEYLLRLFMKSNSVATLSRGYGRKTTGFVEAHTESSAKDVGDEPLQFYRKFGQLGTKIFVHEKRAKGLEIIENIVQNTQLILLDDVFQHRAVQPNLLLLMTDYQRLFTDDYLLPNGRLRESRSRAARAQAVVVSKCPANLSDAGQQKIRKAIQKYTTAPVFFSTIITKEPINYADGSTLLASTSTICLLSAIAQPDAFEDQAEPWFKVKKHFRFADHHHFTATDIERIMHKSKQVPILTTEKDWVKLGPMLTNAQATQFFYWPIEAHFLHSENNNFDDWILKSVTPLLS